MAVGQAPPRAPYACDPEASRGRLFPEPPSRNRSAFRRDCDRIIHSTAFRRLKHKTQVFVYHEGDHYRTRLTHSLEVAQIARCAGAPARPRRGPRRDAGAGARSRPSAVRPCRRARARRLPRGLRRLRPQRAGARSGDAARAPLSGVRRAQPDLGNARRHRQAQRPADRSRRQAGGPPRRARRAARHRRLLARSRTSNCGALRASRRRSPRSPTTSPTTPMTSTTACAPGCSRSAILRTCRWPATSCATSTGAIPRSTPTRRGAELVRELISRLIEDVSQQALRGDRGGDTRLGRRRAAAGPRASRPSRRRWRETERAIKRFPVRAHVSRTPASCRS